MWDDDEAARVRQAIMGALGVIALLCALAAGIVIAARRAEAACRPNGQSCRVDADCCSNNCNNGCRPAPGTTVPTVTTTTRPTTSTLPGTTTTTTTPSTTTTTQPPVILTGVCRPPGADYSVRIPRQNFELYFNRSSPNVRFASNQERDCLEEARIASIRDLVITLGDVAPLGKHDALDCLSLLMSRIEMICPYRGCSYAERGAQWNHNTPGGRDYQCSGAALQTYRNEIMTDRVRPKAQPLLASAVDLRNVLDVDVELGQRAAFQFFGGPDQDIGRRASQFIIDTRRKFPPCGGGNGCVELANVLTAHHCAGLRKTGRPLTPDCTPDVPSVPVALVRYEAGCGADEHCHWFRRLHPFSGYQDRATWSPQELNQIADLEHMIMEQWGQAQAAGAAPRSEANNARHKYVHLMENIGQGWSGVFPWDGVEPDQYKAHQGNTVLTPRALLPLLVKEYGIEAAAR